ncbi:DIP1984 family protein [Mycobacterium sp. BMJ-28]
MKLAEALSLRGTALRHLEALRTRIADNARFQEGEEPSEDAAALLIEAEAAVDEWESLIQAINRTNAVTDMGSDGTLTDALGRRDALRWRRHLLTTAADAAAGSGKQGYTRQLRSELKMLAALPVAELRARADQVARELRELDVRIQQKNWEVDLRER